jgi:hypothetical protein
MGVVAVLEPYDTDTRKPSSLHVEHDDCTTGAKPCLIISVPARSLYVGRIDGSGLVRSGSLVKLGILFRVRVET